MSLKCYFHPEREATSKCEKCGKLICLECKLVYHETYTGGSKDTSYAYSKRYEYCPFCYYETKIKKYKINSIGLLCAAITFVFMLVFYITFTLPTGFFHPTLYIPVIIISIGIIITTIAFFFRQFIQTPKKVDEIETKIEEFLKSIGTPINIKEEGVISKFCPECGTTLESGASICSYCGYIIKE